MGDTSRGALGSAKERIRTWKIMLSNKKKRQKAKSNKFLRTLVNVFIFILYLFRINREKSYNDIKIEIKYQKEIKIVNEIESLLTDDQSKKSKEVVEEIAKVLDKIVVDKQEFPILTKKVSDIKIKVAQYQPCNLNEENKIVHPTKNTDIINSVQINTWVINKVDFQYLKKTTKNLDEITAKIDSIESKIKTETVYSAYYDYTNDIKILKSKLCYIKEQYSLLKKDDEYSNEITLIDKYLLIKDGKNIDKMLDECDSILEKIEIRKKELISGFETKCDKKDVQIKNSPDNKKNKDDKKSIVDNELIRANILIINEIEKDLNHLLEIKQLKKPNILSYASFYLKRAFVYVADLFPFMHFKNKMLGTLVSGIMLNNSIKTTRKLFNNDLLPDYITLNNLMNQKINDLSNIKYVLFNTLSEVNDLRVEIIGKYGIRSDEVNDVLIKLDQIEERVTKKIEQIDMVKSKAKQRTILFRN